MPNSKTAAINKKFLFLALLVGLALLYYFWPTPLEKLLNSKLEQTVAKTNISAPLASLEALFEADDILQIFSDSVEVHYRSADFEYQNSISKAQAKNALTVLLQRVQRSSVVFSNFSLIKQSKNQASVKLFLIAEWQEAGEEEAFRAAEEVQLEFKKIESEWKIVAVETFVR